MLSHIRETVDTLPDLAGVDWEHLDLQALHSAVSGILRTRSAVGGASDVVLHAMAGANFATGRRSRGLSVTEIAALPMFPHHSAPPASEK